MNLTEELYAIKCRLGMIREIDCSDSENEEYRKLVSQGLPLPKGVMRRNPEGSGEYAMYYIVEESPLSREELAEYIQYKQLENIVAIRKCVVFFTVLTIISLIIGAISALAVLVG